MLGYLLFVGIVLAVIFLVCRELFCWYWKINQNVALLTEIRDLLAQEKNRVWPNSESRGVGNEVPAMEELRSAYSINSVVENSYAQLAGVRVGDVLIEYNGHPITSDQAISNATASVSTPTSSIVVIRGTEAIPMRINAGRMGIDGSIIRIDDSTYSVRRKWAEIKA